MDKILTIVVPTYNMEKYLRKCLDSLIVEDKSLLNQMEVLVVNDGSRDSSSTIAHDYQNNYPQVFRVIDKENGNYGSCVNKGLEFATGKYFRILDADDWFDGGQLEQFMKNLKDTDSDVVISNYTRRYGECKKEYISVKNLQYNKVYEIDLYDFSSKAYRNMLLMHAMTYKTDLLKSIEYKQQTGISYTDIEYCYFPFSRAKTMMFVDINLYQYYLGREGQTMQRGNMIRSIDNFSKVATRVTKDYLQNKVVNKRRLLPLVYIISNPIYQIYLINLLYQKEPTDHQKGILEEVELLVQQENTLKTFVYNYTYKKIPFVKIWKKFGCRVGKRIGE